MEGRFLGREWIRPPRCPFCGGGIEPPRELTTRMPYEMPVGACACGAVYACDVTGHNLGTALIDALVLACNADWDLAWGLLPEDDYLEAQVTDYDLDSHQVVPGGAYEGRRVAGVLYFIKLQEDIREVTGEPVRRRLARATPVSPPSEKAAGRGGAAGRLSKQEVEALVRGRHFEPLLAEAGQDNRMLRLLKRLLYAVDRPLRWRSAEALGEVSAVIAERDPGAISRLLQGLFTSVADTAASSWGAIDAIGEIIKHRPDLFSGYLPQLLRLTADRALLAEVIKALAAVASRQPSVLRRYTLHFIPLLHDQEAEIRGNAVRLIGYLAAAEARDELESLAGDGASVEVYEGGWPVTRSIRELVREALERL